MRHRFHPLVNVESRYLTRTNGPVVGDVSSHVINSIIKVGPRIDVRGPKLPYNISLTK